MFYFQCALLTVMTVLDCPPVEVVVNDLDCLEQLVYLKIRLILFSQILLCSCSSLQNHYNNLNTFVLNTDLLIPSQQTRHPVAMLLYHCHLVVQPTGNIVATLPQGTLFAELHYTITFFSSRLYRSQLFAMLLGFHIQY